MMRLTWRYLIPLILLSALLVGCQSANTSAGRCRLLGDSPDDAQEWNQFEYHAAHSTVRFCLPDSWEEIIPEDIGEPNRIMGQIPEYFQAFDPGQSETFEEDKWHGIVSILEDPGFFDPQLRSLFNKPTLAEVATSRLLTFVALAEEAAWAQIMQESKLVTDEQDFAVANLVLRETDPDDADELLTVDMHAYAATPYTGLRINLALNGMHYQPGDEDIFEKFLSTLSVEKPE